MSTTGVGRWFFNVDKWRPSPEEWALALAELGRAATTGSGRGSGSGEAERLAVTKFVFERDRKLAMGSRLLQRYAVRRALGLDDGDFAIAR